jgi:hypothetical protein
MADLNRLPKPLGYDNVQIAAMLEGYKVTVRAGLFGSDFLSSLTSPDFVAPPVHWTDRYTPSVGISLFHTDPIDQELLIHCLLTYVAEFTFYPIFGLPLQQETPFRWITQRQLTPDTPPTLTGYHVIWGGSMDALPNLTSHVEQDPETLVSTTYFTIDDLDKLTVVGYYFNDQFYFVALPQAIDEKTYTNSMIVKQWLVTEYAGRVLRKRVD